MTVVIHKVRLAPAIHQTFTPAGRVTKLLTIQNQKDVPCLWFEVDPDAHGAARNTIRVWLIGTGDTPPPADVGTYLATTQQYGGTLVWHWYAAVVG